MPRITIVSMKSGTLTAEKVHAALVAGDGSPTRAAAILGVSRQTVHAWMVKHSIRVDRVVRSGAA